MLCVLGTSAVCIGYWCCVYWVLVLCVLGTGAVCIGY